MNLKSTLLLITFCLFSIFANSQNHECGSHHGYLEEQKDKFPQFYKSLENKNLQLEENNAKLLSRVSNNEKSTDKKIIPVVVHIIHNFGSENVSDAQVRDAISVLNENINGQDPQFISRTPDVFAAVVGKPNLEFRLATKDPYGNPTSGINRIQSEMTQVPEPRDQIKAMSYWNSYQYLNIWVVKSLPTENGGVLLGYAQFPFGGSMSTDGVAIIANQFSSTSSSTLTHEVGHWLGLRHVWGDAVCGDDNVADTPPQRYSNGFGDNPGPLPTINSFPYHVGLQNQGCIADSLNWAGEMFMNYMDYTDDQYCTMFTEGQVDIFNRTLDGEDGGIGYREYMWQEENLIATGTNDGAIPPSCSKQADFQEGFGNTSVCLGEEVWFKSNKSMFGSSITSVLWDLGDGNTSAVQNNYLHTYSQANTYNVSLTINYNEETQVSSTDLSSIDLSTATSYDSTTNSIIVQGTQAELNDMGASSITTHPIDSLGVYFGLDGTTFYRGFVDEVIYTAYYNNSCTSTKVKNGFISVNSETSSNTASEYSYNFANSDISNDWQIVAANENPSEWAFNASSMSSWEHSTTSGGCMKMPSKDGSNISVESLISDAYNLSSLSQPAIKFEYTGAAVNTYPSNELNIYYSVDCGNSWSLLGKLTNLNVARAGLYTTEYKPMDWADTVMTKNALKNDNVQFKFEYSNTGASNNFYLDNIQIGEEDDLMKESINFQTRMSLYPNPSQGNTSIIVHNLRDENISVKVFNILAKEIQTIFDGQVFDNYLQIEADLSSLEKGMYFVTIFKESEVLVTDKLLLNK